MAKRKTSTKAPAKKSPAKKSPATKKAPARKAPPVGPRTDALGDPLPEGAIARLGTDRLRTHARSLAWSDDGRRLATGQHGQLSVWETDDGRRLAELECKGREDESAEVVRLDPTGAQAAAILKGQLRLFDVASAKERAPRPAGTFDDVAFVGPWLVCEQTEAGSPLLVLELETLDLVREVPLTGFPSGLGVGEEGRVLAARVQDGRLLVHVLDPATGKVATTLGPVDASDVRPERLCGEAIGVEEAVAFAATGGRVVCAVGRRVVTWDVAKAKLLAERQVVEPIPTGIERPWELEVSARGLSRDGETVAVRTREGPALRLLDVATGETLREVPRPAYDALAFSPDGARLAFGPALNRVGLLDLATGVERPSFEGHSEGVGKLWFSPDGEELRSTSERSRKDALLGWDLATRRLAWSRPLPGALSDLAPDGETGLMWVPGEDGDEDHDKARVAHVRLGAGLAPPEPLVVKQGEGGRSRLAGDGHALTILKKTAVVLWRLSDGAVVQTFDAGGKHQIYGAALSPDGKTLATGGWEGKVHLWDRASGKRTDLALHRHGIMSVAFSPDGEWLATASQDRQAVLVSMKKGHEFKRLKHKKEAFYLSFSPDSRFLATGGAEAVRVWDVATGKELWKSTDAWRQVAFSPDGKTLAAGSSGPILLFDSSCWDP